jgi:hypothetical protein
MENVKETEDQPAQDQYKVDKQEGSDGNTHMPAR